ncbi:MAG TPA: c-type cytochrome domain-containing protein [Bryobacteraceae bacterium]|nr:c-type cytochrome domain-containing protein [Bryobacteraceae bacterium]
MRVLILTGLAIASAARLAARVNFARDVKPILENHCVRCHGAGAAMRGVRMDRRERALLVVVKKKPDDSLLYTTAKVGVMPPGPKKLTPVELETLRKWIAEGAGWPDGVELVGKNPFAAAP